MRGKRVFGSRKGATMVEYALMVALIAVVCIAVVTTLGGPQPNSLDTTSESTSDSVPAISSAVNPDGPLAGMKLSISAAGNFKTDKQGYSHITEVTGPYLDSLASMGHRLGASEQAIGPQFTIELGMNEGDKSGAVRAYIMDEKLKETTILKNGKIDGTSAEKMEADVGKIEKDITAWSAAQKKTGKT